VAAFCFVPHSRDKKDVPLRSDLLSGIKKFNNFVLTRIARFLNLANLDLPRTVKPGQNQRGLSQRNIMKKHFFKLIVGTALVFVCFGLSQMAQTVTPAPDGGYHRANGL